LSEPEPHRVTAPDPAPTKRCGSLRLRLQLRNTVKNKTDGTKTFSSSKALFRHRLKNFDQDIANMKKSVLRSDFIFMRNRLRVKVLIKLRILPYTVYLPGQLFKIKPNLKVHSHEKSLLTKHTLGLKYELLTYLKFF
jgi:hypothetical protein